jgi:hypothetical protein
VRATSASRTQCSSAARRRTQASVPPANELCGRVRSPRRRTHECLPTRVATGAMIPPANERQATARQGATLRLYRMSAAIRAVDRSGMVTRSVISARLL